MKGEPSRQDEPATKRMWRRRLPSSQLRYALGMPDSHQQFTVTYDGPALDDHIMSLDDFAESLLGLSGMLSAAHRVAAPKRPAPSLSVKSTKPGSFEVDLIIYGSGVVESIVDKLLSRESQAVLAANGLLTVVAGAVLLVKKGVGRIRGTHKIAPGMLRVTNDRGEEFRLPEASLQLAQDKDFRKALDKNTAPLDKPGFESISISSEKEGDGYTADKADRAALRSPEPELPEPEEWRDDVTLEAVRFQDGGRWRLRKSDGEYFSASVLDFDFLEQVSDGRVRFSSNDALDVSVRTEYRLTRASNVVPTHAILEVHQHFPGVQQPVLPVGQVESPDEGEEEFDE